MLVPVTLETGCTLPECVLRRFPGLLRVGLLVVGWGVVPEMTLEKVFGELWGGGSVKVLGESCCNAVVVVSVEVVTQVSA